MDLFSEPFSYQNLLHSQQPNPSFSFVTHAPSGVVSASDACAFGTGLPEDANQDAVNVSDHTQRQKWSPTEDKVLISAWLNTSKDAVVGNEQKATAFWKRIAAYFGSSPQLAGCEDPNFCKSRWGKINEGVCKFVGSYEAATKQKTSGQSEDDVMKMAHDIFFNDHHSKFTLDHCWLELRHDQKWCGGLTSKESVSCKRRKLDAQSPQSSTSVNMMSPGGDDATRPPGVKAAKGKSKASVSKGKTSDAEGKLAVDYQNVWEIKQKDYAMKEKKTKHKLLESLLGKTEPLTELEIALKDKLINEMLAS